MQVDVLLVDDEEHIRSALLRVLRREKISVDAAASAEEALLWLESNQAALILSDYRMPGLSGTEFLARVEARWPDTNRIILSGHADFDTVLNAVHSGVVHKFLAKPWANQELIEHIKTSLVSSQRPDSSAPQIAPQPGSRTGNPTQASEVKLQVVLDTVVDGVVTIDQQGVILSVNLAVEGIFGYSPAELIGNNVSMLMPEPYRSQHDHYLSQYRSPGTKGILGNQRRLVGLRKNGEVFPIELSVNSMQIEGSVQFLGMIRDISRRVEAERQNQLFLDALEIAQDGVALFGAGDRLIHCNRQFRQLYESAGVSLETGQTYEAFFRQCLQKGLFLSGQSNPEQWLAKQLQIHGQLPVTEEYELQPGQWIEIHETQAENGSVIVSHLDISKQKQTQLSLQNAVAEAEHANSARGRFLAMMSHEIRTPLNGVLGLLQLLEDTSLSSEQSRYVESALGSGRGLLTIISDILDFSKIDADKMELVTAPCHLGSLVNELQQLFQLRVDEKSIGLTLNVASDLPHWVALDGQRLRQILINLIGNAIKFTDYGAVTLTVDLKAGSKDERLRFCVTDTGMGIPESEQSKIFSEFTTINHVSGQAAFTATPEGTGLGLAISYKLVNLMGGELCFTSQAGQGSEFWFELPLQVAEPAQTGTGIDETPLSGRVLVVDDSATNRLVARTMLEKSALQVSCAEDGHEAIQLCSEQRFDLILMDISMPGMSGIETLQQLRQQPWWTETPVIAFTAYAQEEDKRRFSEAGMQGHLEKPLDKTVLLQTVAPYLTPELHKTAEADSNPGVSELSLGATSVEDLLKIEQLDQLARDTSEEVLPELAGVFIQDAQSRLQQLLDKASDAAQIERNLHTLGSSGALYGLQEMSDRARQLEAECRAGHSVKAEIIVFAELVEQSFEVLQAHLKQRS